MSAWGRAGRVTLGLEWEHGSDIARDVEVDGTYVGRTLSPRGRGGRFEGWGAIAHTPWGYLDHLPSLDHAVMWVLRRAAPDVWREERGPVWQVMHCGSPNFRGGPGWDAWLPGSDRFGHYHTHADAMKAATS